MLKMEWLNEEGTTTCTGCGRKFMIPDGVGETETICEECASAVATAEAEADLKANAEADTILASAVK